MINRIVIVGVCSGCLTHKCVHQGGQVHTFCLDGQGIGGKGVFLNGVDVGGHTLADRIDQRNADNADRAGKGGQGSTTLLGDQVLQTQAEGGQQGHGRLLLLPLGLLASLFFLLVFQTGSFFFPLRQWIGVLGQLAVQHPDGTAGILVSQFRVVGDHDHQTVLGDLFQNLHNLQAGLGIQSAGGLVSQDDIRVVNDGTSNGHALHLTAGHLVGLFLQLIAQTHPLQGFLGALTALTLGNAGQSQGQFHVGQHGLVGDQVVALEHKANRVVAVSIPIPVLVVLGGAAVDDQVTIGVLIQTADNVQQRGLAATGRSQNGHKFAFAKLQAHTPQRMHIAAAAGVDLSDIFKFKHVLLLLSGVTRSPPFLPSVRSYGPGSGGWRTDRQCTLRKPDCSSSRRGSK